MLSKANLGHNIIGFDLKAIKKVYPGALVRDTLILTRLMGPHIRDSGFGRAAKGKLPKRLIGAHSPGGAGGFML
jgi:hypothetical protein